VRSSAVAQERREIARRRNRVSHAGP
jgi:hypothetical protein